MGHKAQRNTEAIFDYARDRFSELPGFHLQEQRLVLPEDYATAEESLAGREVISEGESA